MRYRSYVWLGVVLLAMLSMSYETADRFRSTATGTVTPLWRGMNFLKTSFFHVMTVMPGGYSPSMQREVERLKEERLALQKQVEMLQFHIASEGVIEQELQRLKALPADEGFFQRRAKELLRIVQLQAVSLTAKVVFREPASWSSSLWINVGEKSNGCLGKTVIAKNSPVVMGNALVGVVEYVGESRSRVRLITDANVVPSVRAMRRGAMLLAKGEVYGCSLPLWRSRGQLLHGVGFNCDFPDEEGCGEELLVKQGDLLVTTGLDGIFPAGLSVGQVSLVHPLRTGACAFELEAKIAAGDLDDISYVTVLPPIE